MPVIFGIGAMLVILAIFNIQFLIGQLLYLTDTPQVAIETRTPVVAQQEQPAVTTVPKEPLIIIPSIQVNAPVVYGMNSTDDASVQRALQDGVLHFAGSPLPGHPGNSVLVGHSSNAPWVPGDYKFVFMNLEKLNVADTFNVNYDGIQYTYKISSIKTVLPDDVSVLAPTSQPTMTLITCTPVGTNLKRLIIHADQVSPVPTQEATTTAPVNTTQLPGF